MENSKLRLVFFNCLNSVGILSLLLITTYFASADEILQTVPENEVNLIAKHVVSSINYIKLSLPKKSIDSLTSNILKIKNDKKFQVFNESFQNNEDAQNDKVKKSAELIFYSIAGICLFLSFAWYLFMVEFDVVKLLVAFINNIVNVGFMACVELLFLYICAPHFITLYPAYVDNFVLATIRNIYCFILPENATYYDFLLYIYFTNAYFFGDPTIENSLINNQNLQNYVRENPNSLNITSTAALNAGSLAQSPTIENSSVNNQNRQNYLRENPNSLNIISTSALNVGSLAQSPIN